MNMPEGSSETFCFVSEVSSTSYSWWESPRVSPLIEGSDLGSNLDRSGDFRISQIVHLVEIQVSTLVNYGMIEAAKAAGRLMHSMQRSKPQSEISRLVP